MGYRGLPGEELTSREKQCVDLVAEGLSDAEIGMRLRLSMDTTKGHIRNARNKMVPHPSGRVELANAWRKMQGEDTEALRVQIIERDAVIEQAPHEEGCSFYQCSVPEWCQPCDCWKSQAPRDALAELKALVWDHCLNEIEQYELNTQQARDGNPYRKEGQK